MSLLISCYYMGVALFAFVNNTTAYCGLLIFNSLCCLGLLVLNSGYTWYALLFYLVYVGGVYILFIFISVFLPNNMSSGAIDPLLLLLGLLIALELVSGCLGPMSASTDFSYNFCSANEGVSYLFLASFLLLGFFLVSTISSSKESFMR
uniref:NADH dehydrogenase subunit 6 n=1 Tax=Dactylogyrus tuba TaxID=231340 RepID=UPI002E792BC0|nr:NADH dehydrogenase subunit 6 [Dactylogyrus tuba]WCF76302.1 NADH dehydrogenase subunit 6 [Dactylogyrus tuba]